MACRTVRPLTNSQKQLSPRTISSATAEALIRRAINSFRTGMVYEKTPLQVRLQSHLKPGRCRSPNPLTIRAHTTAQGVQASLRYGSCPYVPIVHEGDANGGILMVEMPKPSGNPLLVFIHPYSASSRPTPKRCWRSLGLSFSALGIRLNNVNDNFEE